VITYFHISILHIFILPFIKIIVLITFKLSVISPFASYFTHRVFFICMLYAFWSFSFCFYSTILCLRHFTFCLSTPNHVIAYFHINILHIFILLFIKIVVLITSNLSVISPFASCFSHGALCRNLLSFVCCVHFGLFLFALVVQFFAFTICCHISVHASLKKLIICCK
jgi:hypothetical protein